MTIQENKMAQLKKRHKIEIMGEPNLPKNLPNSKTKQKPKKGKNNVFNVKLIIN